MKIALLTDTHFGARSDSQAFDARFRMFFEKVFFPTLKKEGIDEIIHLGDVFDKRRNMNYQTLANCREYFFDKLAEQDIDMTVIVGNHDTFYKNTNKVNSPELLLSGYTNIQVLTEPELITFGKTDILLVPWICDETAEASANALEKSKAKVCFGHFEIDGFAMYRGMPNVGGLSQSIFDRFKLTCSGHYHHRSSSDKIFYLGSPYEMTWSDAEDSRGFHIFDTDTLKMTFVENPYRMFFKLQYDDRKKLPSVDDVPGSMVRLIVVRKENFESFDTFVDKVTKKGPAELKIIEDFSDFESDILDDENLDVEDTFSLLAAYVDGLETDADKERLKTLLKTLYVEAQNIE